MTSVLEKLGDAALADPLFGLTGTLLIYQLAGWLQRRCRGAILLNPVLVSVVLLVILLRVAHVSYADYMRGGQFIGFLLGPATVALALPLYDNIRSIGQSAGVILAAVLVGSLTTSVSAMLIGHALGASCVVVLSLGVHSVTTPVAMSIADQIGGQPSLAAAFTLLTGLTGVVLSKPILAVIQIKDWRARGLGVGTVAHGLGTARMLLLNETAGAYGGIAIGLSAIITSIIVPVLVRYGFRP